MSGLFDKLPDWKAKATALLFFLGLMWVVFSKMDTPFHMDAEAAEIQKQQQSADACATVYQYELMIAQAEEKLNNPAIPEWRKAELIGQIKLWQQTVDKLRKRYEC